MGGIDQVPPPPAHHPAQPPYRPILSQDTIVKRISISSTTPTDPHLSSLELLPDVLLCSGMDVFTLVSRLPPPSCYCSDEDNPTPTTSQALEQATWGTVVFPPHQPRLPSLQPQPNPHLCTGMEPFSPRGHSLTTPVISSSHKDGRGLSPSSELEEANFH